MKRGQQDAELAMIWSMALFAAAIAMLGRVEMAGYSYTPSPLLTLGLKGLAAAFGLLGFAVGGAMGEPLPRDARAGPIPFRLALCWSILSLCPRPGRGLRWTLCAAVLPAYLYFASEPGAYHAASAMALGWGGSLLAKPKGVAEASLLEWLYIFGLCGVGLGALYGTFEQNPLPALLNLGVLAGLVPLAAQRGREVCAARWAELLPGLPPPPALDLSRYEVAVERRAAAERPALPPGAEEQLVDSGTFKVDAAKMLDKLRSYQLTDPRDFLCAWLRCAAASGARHIALTSGATGLELTFDGVPFSAAELSQPYQALVDGEGGNAKRGRHFAYGLLGLYRLRPSNVSVTSRGPDGVATMKAGTGKPPDPASAPEGTVVRVSWPAWAFYWRPALLVRRARGRYGLGPAALTVNGARVPDHPDGPYWRTMTMKGWRAAADKENLNSLVRLHVLGTFIEELEYHRGKPHAWLAHDELELDISQSSVVRGERLSKGLDLLAANLG
jgi:hypothetical protein